MLKQNDFTDKVGKIFYYLFLPFGLILGAIYMFMTKRETLIARVTRKENDQKLGDQDAKIKEAKSTADSDVADYKSWSDKFRKGK